MAVDLTASMEIQGLKESLKIINKVDKKLRLEIGRDINKSEYLSWQYFQPQPLCAHIFL